MRKITPIFVSIVLVLGMTLALVGCQVKDLPRDIEFDESGYEVTFFDDFDGDTLNSKNWRMFNGGLTHGEQLYDHSYRGGYYSNDPDILYVKDSALHICTKYKEGKYGTGWYSSWIESTTGNDELRLFDESEDYVGFAQKYGYFEARCIAPPAEGIWSSFWLLPDEGKGLTLEDELGTATDGAEIDIMESQNYFRNKPFCQHVVHCDYMYTSAEHIKSDKSLIYKVPNMYSEFHTYGVEWTPEKITFYIDGYKTYETTVVVNGEELGTPQVPESMILSVELAGYSDKDGIHVGKEKNGKTSWLGTLDNMDKSKSYDFVVDYVKVMQKKD